MTTNNDIANEISMKVHKVEMYRCMDMAEAALKMMHPMLVEERHQERIKELLKLIDKLLVLKEPPTK